MSPRKSYSKAELAMMFFPELSANSARRRLIRSIHGDREIMKQLRALKYRKNQRGFTGRQAEVILELF